MNSHETFDWVETRVDIHDSIIAKHLKLYICFGDRTLNYLLSVAGGCPNEDSSGYPRAQFNLQALVNEKNDLVDVAKPHTT